MSADFWLALQKDYDLLTARQAFDKQIVREAIRNARGLSGGRRAAILGCEAAFQPPPT